MKDISIIGGGLAGSCLAYEFSKRGWTITLVDEDKKLSPDHLGVIQPYLDLNASPARRWYQAGYDYALSLLEKLQPQSWHQCGVFRIALGEPARDRFQKIAADCAYPSASFVDKERAARLCGIDINHFGLFFYDGGVVSIEGFSKALRAESNFHTVTGNAKRLIYNKNKCLWSVFDSTDQLLSCSSTIVIAGGWQSINFEQTRTLALKPVRGQLSLIRPSEQSTRLKTVVSGNITLTPARDCLHMLGATFERDQRHLDIREQDHHINLRKLKELSDTLFHQLATSTVGGWAGIRGVTPDHLPLIGPVPITEQYKKVYADLHHGRHWVKYPPAPDFQGLYVCTGFGARGLISAPLAARVLADTLTGDQTGVDKTLFDALHPGRFLIKALKTRSKSKKSS